MKMKAFLMFVLLFLCSMGTKAQDLGAKGLFFFLCAANGKVYSFWLLRKSHVKSGWLASWSI